MGELVWDSACRVGESCVWNAATREVMFCDILAGRIHALAHSENLPAHADDAMHPCEEVFHLD